MVGCLGTPTPLTSRPMGPTTGPLSLSLLRAAQLRTSSPTAPSSLKRALYFFSRTAAWLVRALILSSFSRIRILVPCWEACIQQAVVIAFILVQETRQLNKEETIEHRRTQKSKKRWCCTLEATITAEIESRPFNTIQNSNTAQKNEYRALRRSKKKDKKKRQSVSVTSWKTWKT